MIKKCLFLGAIISLILTSCGSTPTTMVQSTPVPSGVEVIKIAEENSEANKLEQLKTFDQCQSASPFKAQVQFNQTTGQSAQESLTLKGNLGGQIGISEIAQVVLSGAVEKQYSTANTSQQGHQEGVDIEVPPHTKQEYTIIWQESRRIGKVEYRENGELKTAGYSIRIGLELVSTSVKDLSCPIVQQTAQPTTVQITLSSTPSNNNTQEGQVFQVKAETAYGPSLETGVYVLAGDKVRITYVSGEWWIGQSLNGSWVSQTPTDADGYVGRDGDRVAALLETVNPNKCRPLPSAPFGSLIAHIGEAGAYIFVGKELEFTAADSGILYLRINYFNHNYVDGLGCPYGDGGIISVRVTFANP